MELSQKTKPAVMVFVGRCRVKPLMNDAQYRRMLNPLLPEIIRTRSGISTIHAKICPFFFSEWSSRAVYPAALIREIGDFGFSAETLLGEKQQMYEDMNKALRRYGTEIGNARPYCHVFTGTDPLNGLFLIWFEEPVRRSSLQ